MVLLICRSKLPGERAMATEKATPGAPTNFWDQMPVREADNNDMSISREDIRWSGGNDNLRR
jgi:hypothetical protein